KYRLGLQAKQQNTVEQNKESNGGSYRDYHVHSSGATTNSSGVKNEPGYSSKPTNEHSVLNREVPIAEALRCQIQVQKRLQEHLEVRKKLQMRIEAQGKYLQSVLEKAQKSPTLDMNSTISLEATRDSLTNFNLALSNLMANMDGESRNENISEKSVLFIQRKSNGSLCLGEEQEKKDIKLKVEGSCINFDLNIRGSYDFFGANGSELEVKKTLAYGITIINDPSEASCELKNFLFIISFDKKYCSSDLIVLTEIFELRFKGSGKVRISLHYVLHIT
ncbi:hypothetical protein HYC85_027081, partial [Camellia sinensis]